MTSLAVLYAVVIGWNGAPAADVAPLRFADDDAAAYARLFRDAGAKTTLLTAYDDDSRDLQADAPPDGPPTLDALLAALARIDDEIARSGAPAELFVVYSGHGDVDHGEGFVQLDGARLTRSRLYDRVLAGRRAGRAHVIVDACKSYFLVYERGGAGDKRRGARTRYEGSFVVDARGPERFPNVGFTLSTSGDTESHEWEELQGGVFSHEVRSALRGGADADDDGAISYGELGAFVHTANAAIENPRFRPRYTVVPPRADASRGAAPMLRWGAPSTSPREGARRVRLDVPALGHLSVEDERGRRLADVHLDAPATLHLPRAGDLFVLARSVSREYRLAHDAAGSEQSLSRLPPQPPRIAARGALHEAFGRLFLLPFAAAQVAEWTAHPDGPALTDDAPSPRERRRPYATFALVTASLTLAAGLASTFTALGLRDAAQGGSQADRALANGRIHSLDGASVGLYATAGAGAAAWAILSLWPDRGKSADPTASQRSVALVPGPGAVGLAAVARF